MVTTGNHDMEAWYSPDGYGGQLARWSLPDNGFDAAYGTGRLLLHVRQRRRRRAGRERRVVRDPRQLRLHGRRGRRRWLDKKLGELRAAKGIDFIVVFFHHCAYSTSIARLRRRGARRVAAAVRQAPGGPGDQRPQPRLRAHRRRQGRRGRQAGADRRRRPTRRGTGSCTSRRAAAARICTASRRREGQLRGATSHDLESRRHVPLDQVRRSTKADTVEWSRVRYSGFSFLSVEAESGAAPS